MTTRILQAAPASLETTLDLVEKTKRGDAAARDRLMRRYLPLLTRWTHGRLPHNARDLNETSDLVQTALLRAFQSLPTFEAEGNGAFFGFLRTIVLNLLRDEVRRLTRRPLSVELPEEFPDAFSSPLASAVTLETLKAYEFAMQQLDEPERDVVIMRIELGLSHQDIAAMTSSPTPNAARMRVARALARLAELMREYRD
jgi:RNA polymerase sigma factor (sigma-70 family)